jgi:hypothetical protein
MTMTEVGTIVVGMIVACIIMSGTVMARMCATPLRPS